MIVAIRNPLILKFYSQEQTCPKIQLMLVICFYRQTIPRPICLVCQTTGASLIGNDEISKKKFVIPSTVLVNYSTLMYWKIYSVLVTTLLTLLHQCKENLTSKTFWILLINFNDYLQIICNFNDYRNNPNILLFPLTSFLVWLISLVKMK